MVCHSNSRVSVWVWLLSVSSSSTATRPNVLFLVSDDMRPELGAYSGPDFLSPVHPAMHTPHLDKLASKSLLLKRAYVQQALCAPSRTSLLTGRRPDTTRVHDLQHYWRHVAGNFTTIPQYFKQQGYVTAGMGKVFHPGPASGYNDPISWTEPYFVPDGSAWTEESRYTWWAANLCKVQQYPLRDQQTASQAQQALRKLAPKAKSGQQPFFLAVGFFKPHLPFLFPENFLEYYPRDTIRLPNNPYAPVNMPEVAWSNFQYLRTFSDIGTKYGYGCINSTLPDDKVLDLRRAYYATISYVDGLVGQVLSTLEELGLANNTIVSFWGDHGWQLGEHGEWGKHNNFDIAIHAPMMVHIPVLTNHGVVTEQLTEFVDLFPSLVEAAGLPPVPLCPDNSIHIELCTEGVSFLPLIQDPKRPWKTGAFSQYPRMHIDGDIVMGYSVRSDRYHYTQWRHYNDVQWKPYGQGEEELYDHLNDPDHHKQYWQARKEMNYLLMKGWRHALPP